MRHTRELLDFGKVDKKQAIDELGAGRKSAIDYLSGTGPYAESAQHPVPALILLDLNMPQISGFQVLEWVRADPALRALPVIIFECKASGHL
ncbi:MAG: hypothetical protein AB9869_24635 [Verrucomicrobiia bacterium]